MECTRCGEKDKKQFFSYDKYRCKVCRRESQKEWENANFIRSKINQCKFRASNKGLECDITEEYINRLYSKQKGLCKYSELPMKLEVGKYREAMSIDRINPNKGYVKGNIQLVTAFVNRMKGDMIDKEFVELIKLMSKSKKVRRK